MTKTDAIAGSKRASLGSEPTCVLEEPAWETAERVALPESTTYIVPDWSKEMPIGR